MLIAHLKTVPNLPKPLVDNSEKRLKDDPDSNKQLEKRGIYKDKLPEKVKGKRSPLWPIHFNNV
jgi:hypothetical protein